ncbi:caveolin-1-like [Asterias rubens]|uniref:caveolin-1-like n=1 Tax=Asterias rubens TaxID=7604 RepID=UPI001455571E|nr:caveolin-1-like [Asterias rubens]
MADKDSDAKPGLAIETDGAKLADIETSVESDIYDMGPQLKLEYDDVFAAPDDYNIFTSITDINRKIFNKTQVVVYSLFSIILGVILSFIWAIIFGLLNVISIYVLQPASKVFFILLRVAGMIFKALIGSFCDPFYRSFALILSRINVAALTATEARPVGMRIHNSNLQIV